MLAWIRELHSAQGISQIVQAGGVMALTAIIFTLEALAAAVTSWVVLGETLTPGQWLGGMLILGGAVLPFTGAAVWRSLPQREVESGH